MREVRAPTDQERIVLLDYLKTAALLPADVASAMTPEAAAPPEDTSTPDAREAPAALAAPAAKPRSDNSETVSALFRTTCSRCHLLPSPARHTAEDWPAVVKRMRGNMRRFGTAEISDQQEREIVSYLQSERRGS